MLFVEALTYMVYGAIITIAVMAYSFDKAIRYFNVTRKPHVSRETIAEDIDRNRFGGAF